MTARLLDGKSVALQIREEVKDNARNLIEKGVVPGLAAVLVGDNPASQLYVNSKAKACQQAGLFSEVINMSNDTNSTVLTKKLDLLNDRDDIDGILLQLPLPKHLNAVEFLDRISPAKDVDGFHPVNVGRMVQKRRGPRPCTPAGVMELLKRENIDVSGKHAVIVGRSDIVGKPMAMLLTHANATVTVCHSRTENLPSVTREGDILIAAIGKAGIIRKEFIRKGAVVVDVGMNRVETVEQVLEFFGNDSKRMATFEKRGSTLVGDVHPRDAWENASAFTPVPGGVGPLTIAMLLSNTLELAKTRRGSE